MKILSALLPLLLPLTSLHAKDAIFMDFEGDGFGEWAIKGTAFGDAPSAGGPGRMSGKVHGYSNESFACSFHGEDAATGELLSPAFKIEAPFINFLIGGGQHETTAIQLLVDGKVVRSTSGENDNALRPKTWNLESLQGREARLRIIDAETESWGFISVDHIVFTDWANKPFPTATRDGQPHAAELVPSVAISGLLIPDGSAIEIYADYQNHEVFSPTALTFDEEGNVLVTETHRFRFGVEDNRNHLYWLHDDIASETVADRLAMHQKWDHKKPLKDLNRVTEVVRLLSDRDGDGKADVSKVYADDFKDVVEGPAAGIFHYDGTTYLACIPNIWILRDTDGDGVADERKVLQDGFGVRVSFSGHDLNGFALGPDGRIYSTIGDRGFNVTTREGRNYPFPNQGAILRFDPDGSNFEVVHTGLRNPKEIAFDKWGNGISVDNNSDQGDKARIVYMVAGADSGWRMGHQVLASFHRTVGVEQRPPNQWMAEKQWETRNDLQPAFVLPPLSTLTNGPSGLAYHPGTGYSQLCKDSFLICDYKGSPAASGIWAFQVETSGASLRVVDPHKFNWGAAVTDVDFGYDGKVYVTDFITGWKSHPDGRVYSLAPEGDTDTSAAGVAELVRSRLRDRDAKDLAMLMDHPDLRIRTRAHLALANLPEALPTFRNILASSQSPLHRLHATWGLWVLARTNNDTGATETLVSLLADENAEIRSQAARALGEAPLKDAAPLRRALKDDSLRVRLFAALSLGRLGDTAAKYDLIALLEENADADAYLRHAGIMGLLGCASAEDIAILGNHESPSVRLAAVVALRRLGHPALVEFLGDTEGPVVDEAIRALNDVPVEEGRPALARLLDQYAPDGTGRPLTPMLMRRLMNSAFRVGTPECALRLLRVARNDEVDLKERLEALRLISLWENPPRVDQSLGRYLPLAPRDPADIRPHLLTEVPKLLEADSDLTAPTLSLATQYDLPAEILGNEALLATVRSEDHDATVRLRALELLASRDLADFDGILQEAATSDQPALAGRALALLVDRDAGKAFAAVQASLSSGALATRKQAWTVLPTIPTPEVPEVISNGLAALESGTIPASLALEVITAAETSENEMVKSSLEAYWNSLPADDELARFAMCLEGGDPEEGATLFASHPAAQCARCHNFKPGQNPEGMAGPHLAGIARKHDAKYFLASMIQPSAHIAPGYGFATVNLKNGASLTGSIQDGPEGSLDLLVEKTLWRIQKSDVANTSNPVSAMPAMGPLLTRSEIRDLVAWLGTLQGQPVEASLPDAQPLDPATLVATPTAPDPVPDPIPEPTPEPEPAPVAEPSAPFAAPVASALPPVSPSPPPPASSNPIWVLLILAWLAICIIPMIMGIRNR